jgi:predicted esterase
MRAWTSCGIALGVLLLATAGRAQELPPATAAPQTAPLTAEQAAIDPLESGVLDALAFPSAELEKQATLLYQSGNYMDAARAYLSLLQRNPGNADALYNLACCYGLLGQDELAGQCLRLAAQAGWAQLDWAKGDADFALVRGKPAFDAVISELSAKATEREAGLGRLAHFQAQAYLPCRVLLPADYDPAREYPLIVGLHGYGDNHERFTGLRQKLGGIPVIFAVPEAPYPFAEGNQVGYSWMEGGGENSDMPWPEVVKLTEKYVLDVVHGLKAQYKVGEVYLLGFSQGCGLAYMVGIANPQEFAGLICCGGWLDEEWLGADRLAAGKGLRMFIVHGNEDKTVEFAAGTGARDKLKDLGYDVTFFEFQGGHRVPEEAMRAAAKWLLRE